MFEGKSFIDILNMGGWTLFVLLGASIFSVTIICFKLVEFWIKSKITRSQFMCKLMEKIKKDKLDEAVDFCDAVNSPMSPVAKAGIVAFKENERNIGEAMEREIMIQTVKLERFTAVLGTLGSIAVYIGLFGTVLGIIRAFHDISKMGSDGISVVIGGVSEALVATAAGLFVAIPAVIAYNFFTKLIDKFIVNMEYCSSAVVDTLKGKTVR
ncbi:MAG: MotA/TolQ/ExbB proton channel family protein [Endomicrobium sp.]|jgi:biopolymer transport protein ExbB/TolQ|nr:MotA/TolQ/ExbB proton channel family protein [Endomicrobium sp.]